MNQPYDNDLKAFNFNPINGSKWYSISIEWWFAKEFQLKIEDESNDQGLLILHECR